MTKLEASDIVSFMKRACLILGVFLLLSSPAYAFWIWTPKTGQWKNPDYSPAASPAAQLTIAREYVESSQYAQALAAFRKLVLYFPDALEAAEAQYYIAYCFEKMGNRYRAFTEYEKLIKTYPNSDKIQEAVKAQFNLGEAFLSWKPKRIVGVPANLWEEHPCVRIFNRIVEVSPASAYAPKALYSLGIFLTKSSRYEEARQAFQKIIDDYPDNELVQAAKYQLALVSSKSSPYTEYDQSAVDEARMRLEEFLDRTQKGDIAHVASQELDSVKERQAKKEFDTASFYEKQGKIASALIYYDRVIKGYSGTSFALQARERIAALKGENQ